MTHTIVPGHVQVTLCTSVLLSLGCQHPRWNTTIAGFSSWNMFLVPMVASVCAGLAMIQLAQLKATGREYEGP